MGLVLGKGCRMNFRAIKCFEVKTIALVVCHSRRFGPLVTMVLHSFFQVATFVSESQSAVVLPDTLESEVLV